MEDKKHCYKYARPAVATDSVVFGFDGKKLYILLVERGIKPYKGIWAIPGGFIKMTETVEEGALRELREEAGIENVYLEQFHVFSKVDRDPRERVLTVAFFALVKKSDYHLIAGDDAAKAEWYPIDELPILAFDHKDIIISAHEHLQDKMRAKPLAFGLLDEKFTITEIQTLFEVVNDTTYDRRNFYRKIMATGFLKDRGPSSVAVHNRIPQLYSFDEELYLEEQQKKDARKYPFDF